MPRGVKKGVSKRKYDRTVSKIKRKGGARNPYAVANAKLGGKKKEKKVSQAKLALAVRIDLLTYS